MNKSLIPGFPAEFHDRQNDTSYVKDRFQAIFEFVPLGICLIGMDLHLVQINAALCRLFGYSADELRGTSWTTLTHPDDLEPLQRRMEQILQGPDQYQQTETRIFVQNGAVVWARIWMSLVLDSTDSQPCFLFHMEDVTECKRVSKALRDDEERFHVMADSCPAMMWATGAAGNVRFLNSSYRDFCGVSNAEIDRGDWNFPIHPIDAESYLEAYNRAVQEHASFSVEARVQRADGEWRLMGFRAEPRGSSSCEYIGHIGLSADITDRVQAEQRREFELSLLRSIHDETSEGILVVNEAGIVVSHNRRFLEIWRINDPDVSASPLVKAFNSPDMPILFAALELVEAPEAFVKRVQFLYEHPDEEDHCEVNLKDGRTLERHSTGLRNQDRKYLGRVWFFRDVTTRKQAEVTLRNAKHLTDEANRSLLAERSLLENERKMLHALIDNIPDFMYVKDRESRFVVANPHLAQAVGLNLSEEVQGKSDFDFFPPEMAKAFYEDEQNVMRTGQPLYNREERVLQ